MGQDGTMNSCGNELSRFKHTKRKIVCFQCSVTSDSFATPLTVARQAPLSWQDYQNGLPFPSLTDLSDPRIEPEFPALAGRLFTTEPCGKSKMLDKKT